MTRLLVLLGLVLILWFVLETWLRSVRRRFEAVQRERQAGRRPAPTAPTELLVRCDRCGAYIPQSRAQLAEGGAYCRPACPPAGKGPAAASG